MANLLEFGIKYVMKKYGASELVVILVMLALAII